MCRRNNHQNHNHNYKHHHNHNNSPHNRNAHHIPPPSSLTHILTLNLILIPNHILALFLLCPTRSRPRATLLMALSTVLAMAAPGPVKQPAPRWRQAPPAPVMQVEAQVCRILSRSHDHLLV